MFKDSINKQLVGKEDDPTRYFSKLEIRELFVFEDPAISLTHGQIESMHGNQRKPCGTDAHRNFVVGTDAVYNVSEHEFLFSIKESKVPNANDSEIQIIEDNIAADVQQMMIAARAIDNGEGPRPIFASSTNKEREYIPVVNDWVPLANPTVITVLDDSVRTRASDVFNQTEEFADEDVPVIESVNTHLPSPNDNYVPDSDDDDDRSTSIHLKKRPSRNFDEESLNSENMHSDDDDLSQGSLKDFLDDNASISSDDSASLESIYCEAPVTEQSVAENNEEDLPSDNLSTGIIDTDSNDVDNDSIALETSSVSNSTNVKSTDADFGGSQVGSHSHMRSESRVSDDSSHINVNDSAEVSSESDDSLDYSVKEASLEEEAAKLANISLIPGNSNACLVAAT